MKLRLKLQKVKEKAELMKLGVITLTWVLGSHRRMLLPSDYLVGHLTEVGDVNLRRDDLIEKLLDEIEIASLYTLASGYLFSPTLDSPCYSVP